MLLSEINIKVNTFTVIMKSYLLSLFTEDVLSVYKKYSQFLWSSSFQPFPPRVHFQLSSIRLRVTQSKMAQKFESASKLADLR